MTDRSPLSGALRVSFLIFPVMSGFAQTGLLPVLPQLTEHFHQTPNAGVIVRFLITGVSLAMILGAPFAGVLAAKFGWRRSLVATILAFTVAGAAEAATDNLWAIVAMRLVVGMSVAVLGALLMAILTLELDERSRDRWIGFVVVSGTLGTLLLIPISGILGGIDWRLPFLLHLAGLAALFAVVPGVKEPMPTTGCANENAILSASGFPFWAGGLGLLVGILVQTSGIFVPFHLTKIGIADPQTIGLAMVAGTPIGALLSSFYGTFRRYLTMKAIFIVTSTICAAGFLTIGFAWTLTGVVVGNIMLSAATGSLSANMFAYASFRSPPNQRARDIGVVQGALSAGPFIGQIFLEPIAAETSPGVAVATLGVIALCCAATFSAIIQGGMRAASK